MLSRGHLEGAHTEVVHVDIRCQDLTQNTQKMETEQGDGRMEDGKES